MPSKLNKIAILSSGGDSPGMNAAIRAAVRFAHYCNLEVYGVEGGYRGLVEKKIHKMDNISVANCIQRGGTILKTDRCIEFKNKQVRDQCREFLAQQDIDGLIVLGGDGSFAGAATLANEGGPNVIGIPCTIDNDIVGTEYCIGFDTARNTALNAIDKIRDTALSLDRNFIIEVMGRSSGFLAVDVGIAGGAEIILIPEFPTQAKDLVTQIQKHRRKKLASIIVAAEADQPGHSVQLAEQIKQLSGIDYRVCILGHTQRGGTPTVVDRRIASIMGAKAVQSLVNGENKKMIAALHGKTQAADFPEPGKGRRYFQDQELLNINQIICDF